MESGADERRCRESEVVKPEWVYGCMGMEPALSGVRTLVAAS